MYYRVYSVCRVDVLLEYIIKRIIKLLNNIKSKKKITEFKKIKIH